MKPDSQHLDFLISQYVDGCLEGANKKSVEQQLLTDPPARKLYEEHREVQDLLDDWGNRIPLINWDEFDQKLAFRLAQETVGASPYSRFRRWSKPLAAAAALIIAAMVGYGVNGMLSHKSPVGPIAHDPVPENSVSRVNLVDGRRTTQPSRTTIAVAEPGVASEAPRPKNTVVMHAPNSVEARDALADSVHMGMGDLSESQKKLLTTPAGGVAVSPVLEPKKDEQPGVSFP
jgi:hypothetical protein